MKEGWKYKRLGEICDFQGGSQPPKSEWTDSLLDGYVRMLQIRDFTQSRKVSPEYVKSSKKLRFCKSDDILLGRYGASVGKVLTGLEGAYNVAIMKTIPNESVISKRYIKRYFESDLFQDILKRVCGIRAAQAGFSKEDIENELVPVPSLAEQQQIVSFLDSEFEKIDALKANAETQLQAAKDLFQKALKEMLTPKDGWEEKKLGEICDFRSGFAFKSSLFTESGEPIIRISDIQNGEIEDSKVVYFNLNSYKENLTKFKVYPNDILIAMSGATTGKVGINKTDKVFYLNQRVGVFRENTKILEHKYLYYFLNNKAAESLKLAIGAAQPNLSTEQINNFIVPIPSLTKQQAIADNLDTLSAKVKQLQENYNETITLCNDLKQSLLKRIFE